MNLLQNVWNWVSGQIIGEVPEEDALCEFDCRRLQCAEGEWESCERRLHRAAGELMPAKKPPLVAIAESAAKLQQSAEAVVESSSGKKPASNAVDACE
jgi:hypothetical protein